MSTDSRYSYLFKPKQHSPTTVTEGDSPSGPSGSVEWVNVLSKPFATLSADFSVSGGELSVDINTSDVPEHSSNLYYTEQRVENLIFGSNTTQTLAEEDDVRFNHLNLTDLTVENDATVENNLKVEGNTTITGNLTVNGGAFEAFTETVDIEDNLGIINSGETGEGITAGFAGWEVDRGTLDNFLFGFQESNSAFSVGKEGETLQAIATREDDPTSEGIAYWNDTANRFDTSEDLTFNGTHLVLGNQATDSNHAVRASRTLQFTTDNALEFDTETAVDLTDDRSFALSIFDHDENQRGVLNATFQDIFGVKTFQDNLVFTDQVVSDGTFISGFAGSGALLAKNYLNQGAYLEVDNVTVRQRFRVYELMINQIRATNGSVWVSSAVKVSDVEDLGDSVYRCFIGEDQFVPFVSDIPGLSNARDLVRAQRFTGTGIHLVQGRVVNVENGEEDVNDNSTPRYFDIDLESGSDIPQPGMDFVRIGNNHSSSDRQGSLYLTADDTGAPFMDVVDEVYSFNPSSDGSLNSSETTKARLGKLEGITKDGVQLEGYGLYSNNVYLTDSILIGDITKQQAFFEFNNGNLEAQVNRISIESTGFPIGNPGALSGRFILTNNYYYDSNDNLQFMKGLSFGEDVWNWENNDRDGIFLGVNANGNRQFTIGNTTNGDLINFRLEERLDIRFRNGRIDIGDIFYIDSDLMEGNIAGFEFTPDYMRKLIDGTRPDGTDITGSHVHVTANTWDSHRLLGMGVFFSEVEIDDKEIRAVQLGQLHNLDTVNASDDYGFEVIQKIEDGINKHLVRMGGGDFFLTNAGGDFILDDDGFKLFDGDIELGDDYWRSDGTFQFGGENGITFDGTDVAIGSDTLFNADIELGTDFWRQDESFQFGGANGITYSGSGAVNIGSNTKIDGTISVGDPSRVTISGDQNAQPQPPDTLESRSNDPNADTISIQLANTQGEDEQSDVSPDVFNTNNNSDEFISVTFSVNLDTDTEATVELVGSDGSIVESNHFTSSESGYTLVSNTENYDHFYLRMRADYVGSSTADGPEDPNYETFDVVLDTVSWEIAGITLSITPEGIFQRTPLGTKRLVLEY